MESVYIRSRFWDSSTVRKLNSNEKLLYMYLITNKEIKPSGIYKFYKDDHITKTGLSIKVFDKCLQSLILNNKAVQFENWIFMTKFLKETFNLPKKILSSRIKKSIENQFKTENVPIELIACFHSIYHTLSIPYPYPLDTILDFRFKILGFRFETLDFRFENKHGAEEDQNFKICDVHGQYKTEECFLCVRTKNFESLFWPVYPPRNGRRKEKDKALEEFIKLPEKDIPLVLKAVRIYQTCRDVERGIGIQDAFRWLRDRKYKEYLIPDEPEKKQESYIDQEFRKIMEEENEKADQR